MSAHLLSERAVTSEDAKLRLMADNIESSSGQMLAFVNQFLANSRADHRLEVDLEPVDLAAATAQVVQQHRVFAKRKQITLETSWPEQNCLVMADPAALNRVIDNLLSNAIKFSPFQKQVSITVITTDCYCELRIQDEGPGFSVADKLRMFHRYARLSARPTGGELSIGLGLSIAQKLVKAMQCELTCDDISGTGARFVLRLPRKFSPSSAQVGN
jgi:two-component system, sensor histidine kinase and response regulator